MLELYDILIVGGGPAAASALLTAKNRGKTVAVVANGPETGSLWRAERITNYPGLPPMSGREMAGLFARQIEENADDLIRGRALNVLPMDGFFGVAVGNDYYQARALILTVGITREKLFPGEEEYLGRGVSYCATCDGMLYRGKTVAVVGSGREAAEDADFLESIGCRVLRYPENGRYEIRGGLKADRLVFRGEETPVDGIFVIKDTVSVTRLVPGLVYENGGIVTRPDLSTDVPGVFAAGDCTGKPYQIARAVGEGNVAALSACEYLSKKA
ncbi:MAG: NAD(P)/FAD-dependent oxidoreductase [Oscillospiraceae bacterium]|nr:NAD(P)/FAD-dependent oxidoreductase [Oscillospiraceae bacterium]